MNRRQKIIISVTGIFLVLLLLVGLTYAYFLTKISGNTNNKSISVSTANLALVYGDGNGTIAASNIIPGKEIEFIATQSDGSTTKAKNKTFTVKNEGNATTDYVVVIEDVKVTNVSTGAITTFESNDFRYTLTCTTDGDIACSGVENEVFPMNGGIVIGNNIEVGKTHTYTLTMEYLETGKNQSDDMNKSFTAKINIKDISAENPYSSNTSLLSYNIINNAITGKNGTTLQSLPDTKVAQEISDTYKTGEYEYETVSTGSLCAEYNAWLVGDTEDSSYSGISVSSYEDATGKWVYDQCSNWTKYLDTYDPKTSSLIFKNEVIGYEKVLSVTPDDYGTSYYYRGNVEDNYVEFNNMCWRIVRIEGDGSVKITLAAQKKCSEITDSDTGTAFIGTGNYGYTETYVTNSSGATSSSKKLVADYLNGQNDNEYSIKTKLDAWLASSNMNTEKLKYDKWCLGNLTTVYDSKGNVLSNNRNTLLLLSNQPIFYYDVEVRLAGIGQTANAKLNCSGNNYETFNSYIGILTADEVVYAGITYKSENNNYYLNDNTGTSINQHWATLSLSYNNGADFVMSVINSDQGFAGIETVNFSGHYIRPAVTLNSSATITSGDGTKNNPYVVE